MDRLPREPVLKVRRLIGRALVLVVLAAVGRLMCRMAVDAFILRIVGDPTPQPRDRLAEGNVGLRPATEGWHASHHSPSGGDGPPDRGTR